MMPGCHYMGLGLIYANSALTVTVALWAPVAVKS